MKILKFDGADLSSPIAVLGVSQGGPGGACGSHFGTAVPYCIAGDRIGL